MARLILVVSLILASLMLVAQTQADDQWMEWLRHRLTRDRRAIGATWRGPGRQRTTTRRPTTTTVRSSTRPPSTATTTTVAPTTRPAATTTTTAPTTTARTTTNPPSSFTTFQSEALAKTNEYRVAHCAPKLVLNSTLNTIAQNYANQIAASRRFEHSGSKYGENLYMTGSSQAINIASIKGSEAVIVWYKEADDYSWGSPGFSSATGHFTQLVWAATTQLGMGIACTSDKKACYVVANYAPAGNVQGQFPANVKQVSSCT